MTWYYTKKGIHVYVLVFLNGAKCGELVFRQQEFEELQQRIDSVDENLDLITLIEKPE